MCFRRGSVWKSWNECLHVELVFCQKKGQQGGWSAVRTWTGTKKILTGQNVQRGGDQINHPRISCVEGIGGVEKQVMLLVCGSGERRASEIPESKTHVLFLDFCQKTTHHSTCELSRWEDLNKRPCTAMFSVSLEPLKMLDSSPMFVIRL